MSNVTNVNQPQLVSAISTGVSKALEAMAIVKSGAARPHKVNGSLGDTNNYITFGALSAAAFKDRRDNTFTVHTISDAQSTMAAYSLQGSLTLSNKRMAQANNPLTQALNMDSSVSLGEAYVADQIAQSVTLNFATLIVHVAVARAVASSTVYDMSGETPPADKITAATHLTFLSGMRLKYRPVRAPKARAYIGSLDVGEAFANIINPATAKGVYESLDGDVTAINGVPFYGLERVDADAGVISSAYGTISTDETAKHRLIRLEENAVELFTTADPRSLSSVIDVRPVGNSDTGGEGPGVQISYHIEIGALCYANMPGGSKPGVVVGLCHI